MPRIMLEEDPATGATRRYSTAKEANPVHDQPTRKIAMFDVKLQLPENSPCWFLALLIAAGVALALVFVFKDQIVSLAEGTAVSWQKPPTFPSGCVPVRITSAVKDTEVRMLSR